MATPQAYHCVCTTMILATNYNLETLPVRAQPALDRAIILPMDTEGQEDKHVILQNVDTERQAIVIRREDGFEKRILLRCQRCDLVVAYKVHEAVSTAEKKKLGNFIYILPGALMKSQDMEAGVLPRPT